MVIPLALAALLAPLPESLPGAVPSEGAPPQAAADSVELMEEAREAQAAFEAFRESRIPPEYVTERPRCDERIGRICIWFGGPEEENFPAEPPETGMARSDLVGTLQRVNRELASPWVLGQLVHYLAEAGNLPAAERIAEACGIDEGWWCDALRGYVRHLEGRYPEAEEAFQEALAGMPEGQRERWLTPRYVLSRSERRDLERSPPQEREVLRERLWRFSEPLFLTEGNDRLTEHFARLVKARNRADAANPHQIPWDEDLEESLVRYGRSIGWSRSQGAPRGMPSPQDLARDTRRMVGHHHPASRGYLFPEQFLEAPAEIPPESWVTAPREARTWYAPSYAPDFRGLESQMARFRRGDSLLVVGAFQPDPEDAGEPVAAAPDPDDPFAPTVADDDGPRDVQTGLILVQEDGEATHAMEDDVPEGVLTLRAPPGRYVASLEVFEPSAEAAWRARHGVAEKPLAPGEVALSDILLLERGAPFPETLDDAIPHARRRIRIGHGEPFIVAWEAYGLEVDEGVDVTLGFTEGRPDFLRRVGEFLGLVDPDEPVEVTFEERGPEEVDRVFRALELELPELEPGDYTLHVRLERPGEDPVTASRPITIE